MSKIWNIIKIALFVVTGILILIFPKTFIENEGLNINLYVGIVIAFYGLEPLLISIIKKEIKIHTRFLNSIINIILAIIMIFLIEGHDFEVRIACVIWCVWSIMRESEEIYSKVIRGFNTHPVVSVINLIESIVIIWLSINLITAHNDALIEEALLHVYLLSMELILEVIWEPLSLLEQKLWEKRCKNLSKN